MTSGRRTVKAVVAVVEDVAVEGSVLVEASAVVLGVDSGVDSEEASAGASVVDGAVVRAVVAKETEAMELPEEDTEVVGKEADHVAEVSEEAREGDAAKAEAGEATAAVTKARAMPRSSSRSSRSPPHLYQKFDHLSLDMGGFSTASLSLWVRRNHSSNLCRRYHRNSYLAFHLNRHEYV